MNCFSILNQKASCSRLSIAIRVVVILAFYLTVSGDSNAQSITDALDDLRKTRLTLDALQNETPPQRPSFEPPATEASLSKVAFPEKPAKKSNKTALSLDSLGGDDTTVGLGNSEASKAGVKSKVATDVGSNDWHDNLRQTIDLSFRPVYSGPTGRFGVVSAVGLDLLKIFSNKEGDWGVLTLQPYLLRIDNIDFPNQSVFEDRHDFELQYRIFNFNYTGFERGKPNLRIGHFELPFGLEHVNNTNGTIRDFTHLQNFGIDTDWGVSLNGDASSVEYEVGLTRGSGNKFRSREDPFVLAGRVGTPRSDPVAIGVSALHGEFLQFDGAGGTIRRSRVGIDGTWSDEKYIWLGELSAGFEDDNRAYTGLIEADWYNRDETLLVYNQLVVRGIGDTTGWDTEVRHALGFRRECCRHLAISGQINHYFDRLGPLSRGTEIQWQARYRF